MRSQTNQFVIFVFDLTLSNEKRYNVRYVSRYNLLKIVNHLKRNFVFQNCR